MGRGSQAHVSSVTSLQLIKLERFHPLIHSTYWFLSPSFVIHKKFELQCFDTGHFLRFS